MNTPATPPALPFEVEAAQALIRIYRQNKSVWPSTLKLINAELTAAYEAGLAANAAGASSQQSQAMPDREKLLGVIREELKGLYYCCRVWRAWSDGTMTENDFEPAEDGDFAAYIADAVQAALSQPGRDAGRLDWMIQHGAYISWSQDSEVCNVWLPSERDGTEARPAEGYPQKCYDDPRKAIDAAIASITTERDSLKAELAALRAQRVPMTDERIEEIFQSCANDDPDVHIVFARAIEAAVSLKFSALWTAADVYYRRYCQDEAAEDGEDMTGCTAQQHRHAKDLRDALATLDAKP